MRAQLLSTELELARRIQSRLLPPSGAINLRAPFAAWGISQACYDVGGDTYDAVLLPSGECAFWVADVSGKGIGAALLMMTLQTELRALARAEPDLAQLAAEMNTRVQQVAPLGTYATLFFGVLDAATERLRYVNAGHLFPIWLRGDESDSKGRFDTSGMPVGLLPGSEYEAFETRFARGSRLALFSDGMTDAENTDGSSYEDNGLNESFARADESQATSVEEIGAQVFAELDRFRMGAPAKDDTTLLVVGLE